MVKLIHNINASLARVSKALPDTMSGLIHTRLALNLPYSKPNRNAPAKAKWSALLKTGSYERMLINATHKMKSCGSRAC